jgi:hypothetical protein
MALGMVILKDFDWASSWPALSAKNQAALRAMVERAARDAVTAKIKESEI